MNSRVGVVNVGLPRIVVWGGIEISTGEVMLDLFFIMASIRESFLDHPHVLVTDEVADGPSEKLRESESFFPSNSCSNASSQIRICFTRDVARHHRGIWSI
jgi:hypothetical protein